MGPQLRVGLALVICYVLCSEAFLENMDKSVRIVYVDEKYFVYVTDKGALSLTYAEAERMCARQNARIWDINDGPLIIGGRREANIEIGHAALLAMHKVFNRTVEQDAFLKRFNLILGRRENDLCKLYLAGPFDKNFYMFTYYNRCSTWKYETFWFVCEFYIFPVSSETEQTPTTTSNEISTEVQPDSGKIEVINEIIANANDTTSLITEVTESIEELSRPIEGLEHFKEHMFRRIDELTHDDATKAANVTDSLFRRVVTTLVTKMDRLNHYTIITSFIKRITERVALKTDVGTDIDNADDPQSSIRYRLQTINGVRAFNSNVDTSVVTISLGSDELRGPLTTTHVSFSYNHIQEMMIGTMAGSKRNELLTGLVEFFFMFKNKTQDTGDVEVNLFFEPEREKVRQIARAGLQQCVFFNVESQALETTGCRFINLTTDGRIHCRCNHTTSFGAMFVPKKFDKGLRNALDIFTFLLNLVSLPCLLFAILVFSLIRQIRSLLTVIHLQLCICLFVCEVTNALQNIYLWFKDELLCDQILGVLLHYLFLTVIAWTTLEGVHILQLMVIVFRRVRSQTGYYLAAGYGIPLVFPCIALIFGASYKNSNQFCFLDNEKPEFWTFLAPLMFMLIVNSVAIIAVMYRLCTINRQTRSLSSELPKYLRGLVCMTTLLGFQWALGLGALYIESESTTKFICLLLFNFFALAQGPMIFVVRIMLVKETRHCIARSIYRKGRFGRGIADLIRPPPPKKKHPLQKGSSTELTEVGFSNPL